jgi:hypothetical protein
LQLLSKNVSNDLKLINYQTLFGLSNFEQPVSSSEKTHAAEGR